MIVHRIPRCFFLLGGVLLLTGLAACGDSRPVADAAAHVYNSSGQTVSVAIDAPGSNGVSFSLAPGGSQWVPLRRADTYTVSSTEPASLGYTQSFTVGGGSSQDVVFDVGAAGRFALEPVVFVPQGMADSDAEYAADNILNSGEYDSYYMRDPAPMHVLPHGVFYTFGDDPDSYAEQVADSTYEVRYQLTAMD